MIDFLAVFLVVICLIVSRKKYAELRQKYEDAISENLSLGRNCEGWMLKAQELERIMKEEKEND